MLEKPRFNWDMPDRYVKLLNFQLEMMNILETRAYEINDEERIPIIKNRLGQEACYSWKLLHRRKKKYVKPQKGLFSVLSNRFKPCHYHIILSLQYQKYRKNIESAQVLPHSYQLQEEHPSIHTMLLYAYYGYNVQNYVVSSCIKVCKYAKCV